MTYSSISAVQLATEVAEVCPASIDLLAKLTDWVPQAGFLIPLHVFAKIGGVSVSIQSRPISGDRADETHSAWTLQLRGVTGATCTVTWCSRRRWRLGRVVSEHHYDHRRVGEPLTFSDLRFSRGGMEGDASTGTAKPQ